MPWSLVVLAMGFVALLATSEGRAAGQDVYFKRGRYPRYDRPHGYDSYEGSFLDPVLSAQGSQSAVPSQPDKPTTMTARSTAAVSSSTAAIITSTAAISSSTAVASSSTTTTPSTTTAASTSESTMTASKTTTTAAPSSSSSLPVPTSLYSEANNNLEKLNLNISNELESILKSVESLKNNIFNRKQMMENINAAKEKITQAPATTTASSPDPVSEAAAVTESPAQQASTDNKLVAAIQKSVNILKSALEGNQRNNTDNRIATEKEKVAITDGGESEKKAYKAYPKETDGGASLEGEESENKKAEEKKTKEEENKGKTNAYERLLETVKKTMAMLATAASQQGDARSFAQSKN